MQGYRGRTLSACMLASASLAGFILPTGAIAQTPAEVRSIRQFDIPALDMSRALEMFGRQSGKSIIFDRSRVSGRTAAAVRGAYDPGDALRAMLTGSGLGVRKPNADTFVIEPEAPAPTKASYSAPTAEAPVTAAEAAPPVAAAVDEVIVTALRRVGTVQTTPVSIAAVSGETLAKLGATQLPDYFRQIPNLNLTQGTLGRSRISIRGVNAAGEATVGLYFDETPITGPSGTSQDPGNNAPDLNLFDVERVEVLRGPQGTLYGASSMAGTLRIIFKKPNDERAEGAVEAGASSPEGGSSGYLMKAMFNQPLVKDLLAVRIVGYYEKRSGYIDNVFLNQKDTDRSQSRGVRALVGLDPGGGVNLTGTMILQKSSAGDQGGWYEAAGRYNTNLRVKLPFNNKLQLYNLTGNWDAGPATLTATGSYYKYDILRGSDFTPVVNSQSLSATGCQQFNAQSTACSATQLAAYRAAGLASMPAVAWQPGYLKARTMEVRATSRDEGQLQWTFGGFYEHRADHIDSHGSLADPATGAVYMPLRDLSYRFLDTTLTQKAVFGELSWRPVPKLTLTAGLRRYDYTKSTASQASLGSPLTASTVAPFSKVTAKSKGWLQKFNISYRATPNLMIYALAAEGYRPGGANNVPGLPASLVVYSPDALWDYEAGLKSTWFDGGLVVNTAVFQMNWSNIQARAFTANGAFSFITNAGRARIRGGELEITARPAAGLTLTANGGYSGARLTEDQANSATLISGTTGRKGDRIPDVPRYTASASASYSWPLVSGFNGLVRADYAYTGAITSTFRRTDPSFEAYGDYASLNLRAGAERDDLGVYVFVTNVANKVGITGAATTLGSKRKVYSIPPRTVGVNIRANFN